MGLGVDDVQSQHVAPCYVEWVLQSRAICSQAQLQDGEVGAGVAGDVAHAYAERPELDDLTILDHIFSFPRWTLRRFCAAGAF